VRLAVILLLVTASVAIAAERENLANNSRTLPGGCWQARNTKATQSEPITPAVNPFDIYTEWGTDVRLSDFGDSASSVNCEIAAQRGNVYVSWQYFRHNDIYYAQSNDDGESWFPAFILSDDSTSSITPPEISASDSNIYVVFRGGRIYWGIYMRLSHDYGATWQNSTVYYTARNWSYSPIIASRDSSVWVIFSIMVDYIPPEDLDMFLYRSRDNGTTFSDTFYVSDTTYAGIGPDLAINCLSRQPDPILHLIREDGISPSTQEILYQQSTDGGERWSSLAIISHNDSIHSFWPQIAAWGDSGVAVCWADYKYSQQEWTGDAFIAISTNNGQSWSEPVPMTSTHGIVGTDITASGDTLLLTYEDRLAGPSGVFANISYDGGQSWQGAQRVSDGTRRCYQPSTVISGSFGHIAWEDSRHDTLFGTREIYYDRAMLDSSVVGIVDDDTHQRLPENLSLFAYPNPFNASTNIIITGMNSKSVRIEIYDLGGRLIKKLWEDKLEGGEKKIVWDATDDSGKPVGSGIYFAVASTPQTRKSSKILLLK
jgi:hypothetical protein